MGVSPRSEQSREYAAEDEQHLGGQGYRGADRAQDSQGNHEEGEGQGEVPGGEKGMKEDL